MVKSLNQAALEIIRPMLDDPDRYGARVFRSPAGATIVDLGLEADGSWLGAKLWIEAAHGGLADVSYGRMQIKGMEVPTVEVVVDHPMTSVIACQAGAWRLGEGEFVPIGSGPARARAQGDRWSKRVGYDDPSPFVLVQLQINRWPDQATLQFVADACRVPVANVTAMIAPSASLVGAVQIASRAFEQCITALGRTTSFDISTIVYGYGRAPVAPVIKDEGLAMGRVNDSLVYGGSAGLWVRHPDDDEVRRITEALPFSARAGADYGRSFADIFEAYGRNFFNVPAMLDSPAKVMMTNMLTGNAFVAGEIDEECLFRSFSRGGDVT